MSAKNKNPDFIPILTHFVTARLPVKIDQKEKGSSKGRKESVRVG